MKLYCVAILSAIMRKGSKHQPKTFMVFEQFVLFAARSAKEAISRAKTHAKVLESLDDDLSLNGHPAVWKFIGIRKVEEIPNTSLKASRTELATGIEISHSIFYVTGKKRLSDLARGKRVPILYVDDDR